MPHLAPNIRTQATSLTLGSCTDDTGPNETCTPWCRSLRASSAIVFKEYALGRPTANLTVRHHNRRPGMSTSVHRPAASAGSVPAPSPRARDLDLIPASHGPLEGGECPTSGMRGAGSWQVVQSC